MIYFGKDKTQLLRLVLQKSLDLDIGSNPIKKKRFKIRFNGSTKRLTGFISKKQLLYFDTENFQLTITLKAHLQSKMKTGTLRDKKKGNSFLTVLILNTFKALICLETIYFALYLFLNMSKCNDFFCIRTNISFYYIIVNYIFLANIA